MTLKCSRVVAAATAAAIALTSASFAPAMAAPVTKNQTVAAAGDLEVSARRRHYYRHHRGNRAVLGAVAGIFGTIAAIAAADAYRSHYGNYGYGYHGYAPYAPAPYYGHPYHHRW